MGWVEINYGELDEKCVDWKEGGGAKGGHGVPLPLLLHSTKFGLQMPAVSGNMGDLKVWFLGVVLRGAGCPFA